MESSFMNFKFGQALVLFLTGLAGTVSPFIFVHFASSRVSLEEEGKRKGSDLLALGLSCGNAFSGGVMLAVGVVHMLGDALQASIKVNRPVEDAVLFPLFYFIGGVLMPFLLEKSGVVLWLLNKDRDLKPHTKSSSHFSRAEAAATQLLPRLSSDTAVHHDRGACVVPSVNSALVQTRLDTYRAAGVSYSVPYAPLVHENDRSPIVPGDLGQDHSVSDTSSKVLESTIKSDNNFGTFEELASDDGKSRKLSRFNSNGSSNNLKHDHHLCSHDHSHLSISTFLMFIVLTTHSIIVGLSIGSAPANTATSSNSALLAIALHKVFESIALGTSIVNKNTSFSLSSLIEVSVYICAAPLGIIAGAIIADEQNSLIGSNQSEIVLLSLAAGSFIYVAMIEVIAEEFIVDEYRLAKFFFFSAGTFMMCLLHD